MSTFKGIVHEFPQIRIDYFRKQEDQPAPLACFLSHVHSDHLLGLESLKAPFVYCSRATKEVLLRLEKYPARMNFVKGILETRKQTYKHLQNLLKCLPLETPTGIELSPGNEIRVTLFDANHCVGAVMFLIEDDGRAILYTGDIRSEAWFVNSLVRNPVLIPYASGVKTLDTIYLDTTFATKTEVHKEFPSKANGIKELLAKIGIYPKETIFYFMSWTFGYEDVWIALSSFLKSQIHLDPYRWSLYRALQAKLGEVDIKEASCLCGYTLGNHKKNGCLTTYENVRIHSCERGGGCQYMDGVGHKDAVYIMPVVSRLPDGTEVKEVGVGGGKGDMNTAQEVEIQDVDMLKALIIFCASKLKNATAVEMVSNLIKMSYQSQAGRIILQNHLKGLDGAHGIKLEVLVQELLQMAQQKTEMKSQLVEVVQQPVSKDLPRTITFPYSRHSSYSELCEFVRAFHPCDVYPCTVDEDHWNASVSIQVLFGRYCRGNTFRHDEEMYLKQRRGPNYSYATTNTQTTEEMSQFDKEDDQQTPVSEKKAFSISEKQSHNGDWVRIDESIVTVKELPFYTTSNINTDNDNSHQQGSGKRVSERAISPPPKRNKTISQWAYEAALGINDECKDWSEFGGLKSTKDSQKSFELGGSFDES